MQVIYKYPISIIVNHQFPIGAEILKAGQQGGDLFIWAKVDPEPDAAVETRRIQVVGTGDKQPLEGLIYIDTVFMPNGLVWHIFEEKNEQNPLRIAQNKL